MVDDLRHKHQQAIEEHKQAIALFSNNIQDRDNQILASQYESMGLQDELRKEDQQIAALQRRYVDQAIDLGKDNIIIIVKKRSPLPFLHKLEKSALILGKNALIAVIYGVNFSFKMQFLRVFRRKNRRFFPAWPFFFVLYMIFYRSALILRILLRPKKFLVTRSN